MKSKSKNIGSRILLILVVSMLFFRSELATAQSSLSKVQGLYIYNFAKHIKWNYSKEFKIGIYGSDALTNEIKKVLKTRKIGESEIVIERLHKPEQAAGKKIIFISAMYSDMLKKVRKSVGTENMLLVTEEDQVDQGASVSFLLHGTKLKFRFNESACAGDGLVISHSLLAMGI